MDKRLKAFLGLAFAAGTFYACGDGDIIKSDENEEVGLQQVLHNKVDVNDALLACLADSLGCKLEMEGAPEIEIPESSSSEEAPVASSSSVAGQTPVSSASDDEPIIIVPTLSSSSGAGAIQSSQSSLGMKKVAGNCKISNSSPEKIKDKVTYTFGQIGKTPTLETLDWNIPEDASLETTIEGLTMAVTVTYATAGAKTPVTVVANKGLDSEGSVIKCAAPNVVGPAVPGACVQAHLLAQMI